MCVFGVKITCGFLELVPAASSGGLTTRQKGKPSAGARDCRRIWIHRWRSDIHWPDEGVNVWHYLTTDASSCRRRIWRKLLESAVREKMETLDNHMQEVLQFPKRRRNLNFEDIRLTQHFIL
jgi:hypothetical protein